MLNSEPDIDDLLEKASTHLTEDAGKAKNFAVEGLKLANASGSTQKAGEASLLLGRVAYLENQKTDALRYFESAVSFATKVNDDKTASIAFNNIGLIHFDLTNWNQAKDGYLKSLEIKEKNADNRGIAISCANIGAVFFRLGAYPEALYYYTRARKIFEDLDEQKHLATAIYNAGLIYFVDENYEEALNCYYAALKIIDSTNDKISAIKIYNNIGESYYGLNKDDEAHSALLHCISLCRTVNYTEGWAAAVANLSTLSLRNKNYDKTLAYCLEMIDNGCGENKQALISAYENLGRVFFAQGNLKESAEHLENAFQLAKSIESKRYMKDILEYLIKVSEQQHDYKKAFQYQVQYQSLKDELHDSRLDRKLAEVKFQNEIEQQQKEAEIERLRNVELRQEKEKSDTLLKNILPDEIAEELKLKGYSEARYYENVSVLFTDFQSFTKVAMRLSPQKLVDELHACFKAFDEIISKYNIEKIKTIGDAYMAASGIPIGNDNHAEDMVKAAIEIRDFMKNRKEQCEANPEDCANFEVRIGINSGPVVAGIVGVKKFAYDIWGDTVNTAARMEQTSKAGFINISGSTYELVKDKFNCSYRGKIEAKNKGEVDMYFVDVAGV